MLYSTNRYRNGRVSCSLFVCGVEPNDFCYLTLTTTKNTKNSSINPHNLNSFLFFFTEYKYIINHSGAQKKTRMQKLKPNKEREIFFTYEFTNLARKKKEIKS